VLVLSEFAGAAAELTDALLVNPYDVHGTADAIHAALTMPAPERGRRMRALRACVAARDAERWALAFLEALRGARA
jgi:trehalose-6-phosphate synthase